MSTEICGRCGYQKSEHVVIEDLDEKQHWLCPSTLFIAQADLDARMQALADDDPYRRLPPSLAPDDRPSLKDA